MEANLKKIRVCIMILGFVAMGVSIGDMIFNIVVEGGFNVLAAFPVFYILVILFNISMFSKEHEKCKALIQKNSGLMIGMFTVCIIAFIGNFATMIIYINSRFFDGDVNMGIIPFTFFSVVTMIVHECIAFSFAMGVRRLEHLRNNPPPPPFAVGPDGQVLLNTQQQHMYQPPAGGIGQPQGYNYLAPPPPMQQQQAPQVSQGYPPQYPQAQPAYPPVQPGYPQAQYP
jgi:hypothetical protein